MPATLPAFAKIGARAPVTLPGFAEYSGSRLVGGIARVIAKHPHANIANAFNHKQVD